MAEEGFVWTVSGTPDRARPGTVLRDVMVEMRDGLSLATDVYLPDAEGPFPAVVIRLPYGKTVEYCGIPDIAAHWNRKGYAFVGQDCRGTYGSEGVFDPAHPTNEAEDGHDTVAWIAEQPWSSGKVALTGESYYSVTSFAAASIPHPALACIAPGDFPVDRYDGTYRNGCLRLAAEALWAIWWVDPLNHPVPGEPLPNVDVWHLPTLDMAAAAGLGNHYFSEIVGHCLPGSRYWEVRCRREAHDAIDIPVLHWCGWFDNYTGRAAARLEALPTARPLRRPQLPHDRSLEPRGPPGPAERVGILPVKEDGTHRWDRLQAVLRPLPDGDRERVRVRAAGDLLRHGRGRVAHGGHVAAAGQRHAGLVPARGPALRRRGKPRRRRPGRGAPDAYAYDPADPVAWTLGTNPWTFGLNIGDRRPIEARADVLVYTSEPFAEPVEIVGDLRHGCTSRPMPSTPTSRWRSSTSFPTAPRT